MNVLMVVFELNPGDNAAAVRAYVERFDAMRFSDSAFAIRTEQEPQEVFAGLQPLLHKDDLAYVTTLDQPWFGYGYEAMNDWLQRNLG